MDKFMDILLQKPIELATRDIIKLAKTCQDETFDKAILQLFVDYLGKNYAITDDDLEEIADPDTRDGFHQLIMEIYESDDVEAVATEVPYGEFIDKLISELFIFEKLDSSSLLNWIEFFTLIIEECTIPQQAAFKAKSHVMLAFILPPLTKLIKLNQDDNPNSKVNNDLKLAINEGVEKIMKNIEIAFKYELYGVECVKHLTTAFKMHPTHFVENVDGLKLFKTLLSLDDRNLLVAALTTLADICLVESLHAKLREFFFPTVSEADDDGVSIDTILSLLNHRNLKSEVIQLLNAIATFEEDFLSETQKFELLMNIFGKNKKVSNEIASMMTAMNVDFWLEIIKMINYYMDPNEVDIAQIVMSLSSFDASPKNFIEMTCKHIGEEFICERAAEMFIAALQLSENPSQELTHLNNALITCTVNSRVTCILLRAFDVIGNEKLITYYKEHPDELEIIDVISDIFDKTKDMMLEKVIVSVLFVFFTFTLEKTLLILINLVRKYSKQYKASLNHVQNISEDQINAIQKLTALMECRYWEIMDKENLRFFYELTLQKVKDQKLNSHFQRLHVNIVKHLWVKLVKNKPFPIYGTIFIENVFVYKRNLEECFRDENYPFKEQCMAFASYLDLLVMWQPAIGYKFTSEMFDRIILELTKEEVLDIAFLAEKLVFDGKKVADYFNHLVMHAYESFYINYMQLPSLTSWETFLYQYHSKVHFKTEIEHIMEHALKVKPGIFDKTVAFTILNMSLTKGIDHFRDFFHTIEVFLKLHQPEVKDQDVRFATICSYVLDKLNQHLNNNRKSDKRLMVLNFLTIIVKNLDAKYKKNLGEFIKLNGVKLSETEIKKVEIFQNMLKI